MALDLNTAKRLIAQRGVQPPPGADFDAWAMAWLENAVNAGDPAAVQAIGGRQAEEGGGNYADFGGAADPQTWLGQRKPTPRELRLYAQKSGQSEDYNRYDDRQLAAWIDKSWDVGQGGFLNDFGDRVEKPTESGARSLAAGYATGERSAGTRGGGGGGAGGGKRAGTEGMTYSSPLAEMLANQGGMLSQYDPTRGDEKAGVRGGIVKGGGIWYQPTKPATPGGSVTMSPGSGGVGSSILNPGGAQSPMPTIPGQPAPYNPVIPPTSGGSLTNMLTPLQSSPGIGNGISGGGGTFTSGPSGGAGSIMGGRPLTVGGTIGGPPSRGNPLGSSPLSGGSLSGGPTLAGPVPGGSVLGTPPPGGNLSEGNPGLVGMMARRQGLRKRPGAWFV